MGNEVKRYSTDKPLAYPPISGETEVYLASDYDALHAEAEALRAENAAALRVTQSLVASVDRAEAELEALRSQHAERQEAVAWRLRLPDGRTTLEKAYPKWAEGEGDGYAIQPLYTSPPSAQDVSGLVRAGAQMANGCFNLSQDGCEVGDHKVALRSLAKAWDAALAAYRNPATVKRCPTCTGACAEICAKARP